MVDLARRQNFLMNVICGYFSISRQEPDALNNNPKWATLKQALTAMLHGGIYDQLAGGFHRYSTDDCWLVPHFEKMLYNQAQLARLYARAGH